MKKFALMIIISVAFMVPLGSSAADKPTSDEARKVVDFYFNGKGLGVVLSESKICNGIEREGDMKNECAGEISGTPAKKGEAVYVWMAYMVPSGDESQNIIVQFEHNGVTRMVKNLSVKGSLRYRTWRKVVFEKVGNWTVKIVHDKGDSTEELGTLNVIVE